MPRMKNTIFKAQTSKGLYLTEEKIMELTPSNIFSTNFHVQTCIKIAELDKSLTHDRKKVYINLLVRKSKLARVITAIRFLTKNKILTFNSVVLPHDLHIKFKPEFSIDRNSEKKIALSLIDNPSTNILIAKYIYHNTYRLIGKIFNPRIIKNDSIVRSFVEVTEQIHKTRLSQSLCLFFPFPFKLSRQLSFYRECKAKNYQVAISGVPYSLKNLIKIFVNRTDQNIVEFEFEAHIKHGKELSRLRLKHYYTEDDYDASAFLIANELMESGCEVINTAHGVNQTCPFINCTIFEVLTRPQLEYYTSFKHTKNISFVFQKNNSSYPNLLNTKSKTKFVFVHGNFKEAGMIYETNLQTKIIQEIERYLDKYTIYIKYHPNGIFFESTNIPILKTFQDIDEESNTVFITINSTSFYSYYHLGVFTFLGDDFCTPFNIVDKDVPFFHYQQVEKLLQDYSNAEFFTSKMQEQYNLINKIQNGLVD